MMASTTVRTPPQVHDTISACAATSSGGIILQFCTVPAPVHAVLDIFGRSAKDSASGLPRPMGVLTVPSTGVSPEPGTLGRRAPVIHRMSPRKRAAGVSGSDFSGDAHDFRCRIAVARGP